MSVVGKDLVGDRVNVFAIVILRKVELDQVGRLQWSAINGVRSVLLQPWQDVCEIEDGSFGRADGMLEWL
ncbi:hypothetical protein KCU90_g136, partial [Aureobasidium melanogenum]